MSFDPQLTPKKQITNLLIILFAGLGGAILLTFFLLYNYGPEGHYLLKNALLSPDVISQMSDVKDNQSASRTVFDKIEFSYQDIETKKRTVIPVDKKTYSKFYSMISKDKSLLDVPVDITAAFNEMPASFLVITTESFNKNDSHKSQIFQEVQLLYKGDYYRLQLRESTSTNWIYFYHPHIYDNAFLLFTSAKL